MLLDKDALLAAINALPDATPAPVVSDPAADLAVAQQQVADLQAKLDAATKALSDEQAQLSSEQASEVSLQASLDAANSKLAAVKAALGL